MFKCLSRLIRDQAGVTPIEYGLIAAIFAVGMTVAASAAGFSLADLVP